MAKLQWQSVVSRMEIEEFTRYSVIQEYQPSDPKDLTFHLLKYGNKKSYQGQWGNELLFWSINDELGYVWTTDHRATEIRDWIRDNLFGVIPGND